jgi:hypothetical protein
MQHLHLLDSRPCIICHICCSIVALKDREERYRLHLKHQFDTLSDAKNIEEQVNPFSIFISALPCVEVTQRQHVRLEAHELHIALGKWESEYFATVTQFNGAVQDLQVTIALSISLFFCIEIINLIRPAAKICTLRRGTLFGWYNVACSDSKISILFLASLMTTKIRKLVFGGSQHFNLSTLSFAQYAL